MRFLAFLCLTFLGLFLGMGSESRVQGSVLRFRVEGLTFASSSASSALHPPPVRAFRDESFRFRVESFGLRVSGCGLRVEGFGFRVEGFGFRVEGFWFRVEGFGFRVEVFGFRI